jgi:predicted AlkP superfamily phosphohydrolase/phosphomutase
MTVFPHTDMGHHLWRYMDPIISQQYPQRREQVRNIFTKLDTALGKLFALAQEREAQVVIMSDHGHGRQRGWVRANKLLQKWGYMTMTGKLKWFACQMAREYQKYRYPDKYSRPVRLVDKRLSIDWSRSKAVVCHTAMWGFLYLNVRGRQPDGIIEPGEEYEACRNDLIGRFSAEKDPFNGELLFPEIIKPETVYGESTHPWVCPDLLLVPQEGMKVNRRTRGKWTVKHIDPATAKGTHLLHGLWMAAGENIKTNHSFQANIPDMTPTLLAMLEIPVPKDMDGKVLLDLFQHPPQVQYSAAKEMAAPSQNTGYSAEEEEQIQQHLADLGYMD